MKNLKDVSRLATLALMLVSAAFAGNNNNQATVAPFVTVPLNSNSYLTKSPNLPAVLTMQHGTVAQGASVVSGDPIIALPFQPISPTGAAVDCANATNSLLPIQFGTTGYVMFPDNHGGGVGWQIKPSGWNVNKTNNGWVMQIDLTSPFWIASPQIGTSPTFVQMMNARSASVQLSVLNLNGGSVQGTLSPRILCENSPVLGNGTVVLSYSSNGFVYLYQ